MNSSLQIGKIMGIPVRLHWTFVLIIILVAWSFGTASLPLFGRPYGFGEVEPAPIRWIYALAFTVLLFICVALHELSHSYVAKKHGIVISSITLYFFGGVASMEEIPRNPSLELRMAAAGPGLSGVIGLACILIATQSAVLLGSNHPFTIFLWTLGWINLILMIFNLLPAFPMDGGRVLRAWLATRMPYVEATRRAAGIGKMLAILMSIIGLFSFNFLLLFIAFFIYIGASEEERATAINISLEGIRVRNIMSSDVQTVSRDMPLRELMGLMFREKHRGYPVVENGELQGIVTLTDVQKVPDEERDTVRVGDVMARNIYVIAPEEEASVAMKMMNERGIRRLPVMDGGRLVGIVSREDLVRAIELCSERAER
jgi:Zn-dependent protease/CBS domain-containing protein